MSKQDSLVSEDNELVFVNDVLASEDDSLLSNHDVLVSEDDSLLSKDDVLVSADDSLLSKDDVLVSADDSPVTKDESLVFKDDEQSSTSVDKIRFLFVPSSSSCFLLRGLRNWMWIGTSAVDWYFGLEYEWSLATTSTAMFPLLSCVLNFALFA